MFDTALKLATATLVLTSLATSAADAQVLGTFRWRFAPFCNVATLQVEQRGTAFQLAGSDDGCGDPTTKAMATGSANLNAAAGTVDMSLVLVRADGTSVTTAMTISQATLSGTWKDNWGNSGALTFNPAAPVPGVQRRLTLRGDWSIFFRAVAAGNESSHPLSFSQPLSSGPTTVEIVPIGGGPTSVCPGNVINPQALPGVLCLYQSERSNVSQLQVFSAQSGNFGIGNAFGASILVTANAASTTVSYGSWAVGVR